ncbi:MAG: hypothetical protein ABIO70_18015 [Pseudomonadota bacterium]
MGADPAQDLPRLRAALAPLEAEAAALPWARERPWRVATHCRVEAELLHLDLHDLNARAAREALRIVEDIGPTLESGAVRVVTGVGRHSLGPGVMGDLARRELSAQCTRHGWSYHPAGAGALVLVIDPMRAPGRAFSSLGPVFWAGVILALLALALAWPVVGIPATILGLVLALVRWWAGRRGARGLSSRRPSDGDERHG